MQKSDTSAAPADTATANRAVAGELTPAILTVWRTGYSWQRFRTDTLAGLTVAILAIPLSMAIAIGSGATPGQGLATSIFAGFLISAMGGTRYQVGGPAAAFIVVMAGLYKQFGPEGVATVTALAGLMLMLGAYFRLGSFITYVSGPVIMGFTSAIGILVGLGQLRDFLGIKDTVPVETIEKVRELWHLKNQTSGAAVLVGAMTIAIILACRRYAPRLPNLLIAIVATSITVRVFSLPVTTIGERFGTDLHALTWPHLPDFGWTRISETLPAAMTLAFLIGVESLLSAVAADAQTGERHRPNAEIMGQGIANIVSALVGGLPATGVIARTATNISAGATSPVAGMMHAVFALVAVLALGSLVAYLPLACLAGLLLTIAWRLIDVREVASFVQRAPRDDVFVLAVTWLLTVFVELNVAIATGVTLAAILLMHRLAQTTGLSGRGPSQVADSGDDRRGTVGSPWRADLPKTVRLLDFHGPMFYGQASRMADALAMSTGDTRVLILRMRDVPLIDATAIAMLDELAARCGTSGCRLIMSSLQPQPRTALHRYGFLRQHRVLLARSGAEAVAKAIALARPGAA